MHHTNCYDTVTPIPQAPSYRVNAKPTHTRKHTGGCERAIVCCAMEVLCRLHSHLLHGMRDEFQEPRQSARGRGPFITRVTTDRGGLANHGTHTGPVVASKEVGGNSDERASEQGGFHTCLLPATRLRQQDQTAQHSTGQSREDQTTPEATPKR